MVGAAAAAHLNLFTRFRCDRTSGRSAGYAAADPMSELLQFLVSGLTIGAVYALVALGFTIIYNASDVVNFAQGEFVMIGGMVTVFLSAAGVALPLAALLAIVAAMTIGLALHRFAIEPARGASAVDLLTRRRPGRLRQAVSLVAGVFRR